MRNKIFVITFLFIIIILMLLSIFFKKDKISYDERRYLKDFPDFELNTDYMKNLEKYSLDHFPFRNNIRKIKTLFNYTIFNKTENNDLIEENNFIYKLNYPTNYKSIDNYIEYINLIKKQFKNVNVLIVPDKNYYLSDKYPKIDYNYIYNKINNNIDIRNILNINDYYYTDTHWKQDKLNKVVKELCKNLKLEYKDVIYKKFYYKDFYGVLSNGKKETIIYLNNDILKNTKVSYLENDNLKSIYNTKKLKSFDSYEVFLDGASSYIEIDNNDSFTEKELIIFRDSFGSSLAPLLVPYYKKITLIDNRYISSKYYLDKINKNNQDVLIVGSTLLINNSDTLKK